MDPGIGLLFGVGMRAVVVGTGELSGAEALAVGCNASSHANVRETAIKKRLTMGTVYHADHLRLFRLALLSNILYHHPALDQWLVQ